MSAEQKSQNCREELAQVKKDLNKAQQDAAEHRQATASYLHLSQLDRALAEDFTLGSTEAECPRRENRDTEGAEGDWGGVSSSPTD